MRFIDGRLYIVCGKGPGLSGGGGLYRVDPSTGESAEISNDWQNVGVSAVIGTTLYVICGRLHGRCGGGGLYAINVVNGTHTTVLQSGWANATCMYRWQNHLVVICASL